MKPFDLTVPQSDLTLANNWWRNLSINQMKGLQGRYFPGVSWQVASGPRWVHQMWEGEGKPQPQERIPV